MHYEGPGAKNPPGEMPSGGQVAPDAAPAFDAASPSERADPSIFACPPVPTAYVFDHADRWTGVQGAADLLAQAGFLVQPLPLDQNPKDLRGLIFFSSFASEDAGYRAYVKTNATNLYTFVDKANVLVEMVQADQTEAVAPFLPAAYMARR